MSREDKKKLLDLVERAKWNQYARPQDAWVVPWVPGFALSHVEKNGKHTFALLTPGGRILRGTRGVIMKALIRSGWVQAACARLKVEGVHYVTALD